MKVKKITKLLEKRYAKKLAYEGDPVGLYFIDENQEVEKVLVTLDLTIEVIEEAIKNEVDLVVTHHPFTYNGLEDEVVAFNNHKEELCRENNLGVYVLHTNYDVGYPGMNDVLIAKLGLSKIRTSKKANTDYMFLRHGQTNTTVYALAQDLKKIFDLKYVRVVGQNKPVKNVAIIGGDGSDFTVQIEAMKEEVDVLITGDYRYTRGLFAKENNLAVIEVPHSIEKVFIDEIAMLVSTLKVDVIKSKIDTDPFIIF